MDSTSTANLRSDLRPSSFSSSLRTSSCPSAASDTVLRSYRSGKPIDTRQVARIRLVRTRSRAPILLSNPAQLLYQHQLGLQFHPYLVAVHLFLERGGELKVATHPSLQGASPPQ